MKVVETNLPGVVVIEPQVFRDRRGFFLETYHATKYADAGITPTFVQDNYSQSSKHILRGLHAQQHRPQGKLIRVNRGEIFDVAVDIRVGSPTFAKWVGVWLSGENTKQMYIPPGFVHGFAVLSEIADIEYKCTDVYDPGDELTILWSDPDINISWPVTDPVVSEKDGRAQGLMAQRDRLPVYRETAS